VVQFRSQEVKNQGLELWDFTKLRCEMSLTSGYSL